MRFRKFCLPSVVLFAASVLVCSAQTAKTHPSSDVAIEGFYQTTPTVSGDGISVRATHSAGGAAFFRRSYRWWLGYQIGWAMTRYTNYYSGQAFGVQTNMHEFSASYLVHGRTYGHFQPFALAGFSGVLFSPSLNGGQNAAAQIRPGINYGAGLNVPLANSHFGFRAEYHGVYYKTPAFGQLRYTTNAFRNTSEPMAGVYFRF